MKNYLIIVLLGMASAIPTTCFCQPEIAWTQSYHPLGDYYLKAIRSLDGGFAIGTSGYNGPDYVDDFCLLKTDISGREQFHSFYYSVSYGDTSVYDCAQSICQMPDSGYALIGQGGHGMLVRTNAEGEQLWKLFLIDVAPFCFQDCAVAADANIVAVGSRSAAKFDDLHEGALMWRHSYPNVARGLWRVKALPDGGYIFSGDTQAEALNARGQDIYAIRADSEGNIIWESAYGTELDDYGSEVIATGDGGFCIAGGILGGQNYDQIHPVIVRLNSEGNQLWCRYYDESPTMTGVLGIAELSDGGFIAVGSREGRYVYLLRVDYAGEIVWQRLYGNTNRHGLDSFDGDVPCTVIVMPDNSYVVGNFSYSGDYRGLVLFRTEPDQVRLPFSLAWPPGHTFDSLQVGSTASWDCYIRNIGRRFAVLDSASFTGDTAAFSWTLELPRRINPTDTLYFPIAFHPPSDTFFSARLRLYYGNGQIVQLTVRGRGLPPNGVKDDRFGNLSYRFRISASPNPFNSTTTIRYALPQAARVKVRLYNTAGRQEATLFDGYQPAGSQTVSWLTNDAPAGVYFCKVTAGERTATTKLLLVK